MICYVAYVVLYTRGIYPGITHIQRTHVSVSSVRFPCPYLIPYETYPYSTEHSLGCYVRQGLKL